MLGGGSDASSPVVHLGTEERYAECEQLDLAAVTTLTTSGQVYATSQPLGPDSDLAAIFRY